MLLGVIEMSGTVPKSMAFHLKDPCGVNAHVIKEICGKIGLWDWKRERFQ
ncbi:hypothetical protein [Occallatibacter riparius]|uniref:Uncharacterized protein n=1 Tax=Occallatibacter riparius TaxID=1002689 RepID=A0A9J7BU73_9BACT|nr:hypothetical protein [Occallatibacter riparius]UWZ85290.1 hypothetical protein MOP44_04960 [Occallatibacter riparius]